MQIARRALLSLCLLSLACADDDPDGGGQFPNTSLDNWCEQNLCDWRTDVGTIERVETWHQYDYGASFVASPTQISLATKQNQHRCFEIDAIADIAADANLEIGVDYNDDGHVERRQRIQLVGWKSAPFRVPAPVAYDSLRVTVRKEGTGRAVLGLLRLTPMEPCGEPPTFDNGSRCTTDAVCTSGHCVAALCQFCPADDCTGVAPDGGAE
jgi:hypothetical protein